MSEITFKYHDKDEALIAAEQARHPQDTDGIARGLGSTSMTGRTPAPRAEREATEATGESMEAAEIILRNKILYHGSATLGIESFAAAEEETVGRGIYFVDNISDASGYARRRSRRDKSAPLVYEVIIAEARLVNLDNPDKLQAVMQGFAAALGNDDLSALPWYLQEATYRAIEDINKGIKPGEIKRVTQALGGRFTEYLKSQGYDGLIAAEGGEGEDVGNHTTYLLFDSDSVAIEKCHSVTV